MANTRISDLAAGAAVSGTDLFPDVQTAGVGPVKVTATQLKTFMSASPTLVTPNIGVATGTSLDVSGVLESGANGGTGGQLKMFGATSGDVTVAPAAAAGTATVFTLPASNGTNKYALLTNGSGVTSWGQIDVTAAITGTVPVANGGTGITSFGTGVATALGNAVNGSGGFITYATFAPASGKTLTVSNTLTFTGTDSSSVAFGTGGTVAYTANNLSVFAATTSAQLAGVISDETGSGALVFATSPSLTTPTLGVASATSVNKVAITAPATGSTLTIADGKTLTASNTLTLAGTDSTTMTFPPASASVGYIDMPQNSKTTSYTTVLADAGKHILMNGSSLTFTIDSNANVAFGVGTVITVVNTNASNLTIAITSDTLTAAGTTLTGSRTLPQNGVATCIKVGTTSWLISGAGLS